MQPNLPPPVPPPSPNPNSVDYLDSISGPERINTVSPFMLWGLIGGVLLVVGLVLILLVSSAGPSQGERLASYLYRVQALGQLSKDSSEVIQSSKLRALNGSMGAILAGAEQEGTGFLAANSIKKLPKVPKTDPVTIEFAALASKLDDARLNVEFDRAYTREIAYQLGQLRAEIKFLSDESKGEDFKTYLEKTDKNIEPLVEQFNAFKSAGS